MRFKYAPLSRKEISRMVEDEEARTRLVVTEVILSWDEWKEFFTNEGLPDRDTFEFSFVRRVSPSYLRGGQLTEEQHQVRRITLRLGSNA